MRERPNTTTKQPDNTVSSKPAPTVPPPAPTVPPAVQLQTTDLAVYEPTITTNSGLDYRDDKDKPTVEELARESRKQDSKALRDINRAKKIASIHTKTSSLQAAAAAGAQVVATFPTGEPCSKAQLDAIVVQWAKGMNMTIEQANEHLSGEYKPQDFVNQFAGLLNNMSDAWVEPEKEISFEDNL